MTAVGKELQGDSGIDKHSVKRTFHSICTGTATALQPLQDVELDDDAPLAQSVPKRGNVRKELQRNRSDASNASSAGRKRQNKGNGNQDKPAKHAKK